MRSRIRLYSSNYAPLRVQCRSFFGPFKKKDNNEEKVSGSLEKPQGVPSSIWKMAEIASQSGRKPPQWLENMSKKNLENLKKMAGANEGVGSQFNQEKLGKLFGKNADFVKKMIEAQEAMLNVSKKADGTGASDTATASSTTTTPTENAELGPEIEELFAELRLMRKKRNEAKQQLQLKTEECETAMQALHRVKNTEADLRERLKRAETDVSLLNSECLDMKEKARELKVIQRKLFDAQSKLSALKAQDPAPIVAKVEDLQQQMKRKDDHFNSMQRKLDRVRQRSPLLQFSLLLSDVARAGGVSYSSQWVDEKYQTVQERYEKHVLAEWQRLDCKVFGASTALLAAAQEWVVARVKHSRLDALVQVDKGASPTEIQKLKELLEGKGFQFEVASADTPGLRGKQERYYLVSCSSANGEGKETSIGPFGMLYALMYQKLSSTDTAEKLQNAKISAGLPKLEKLSPFLSKTILQDNKRIKTEIERTRSSGPGGQAVNVAETQITVKLYVDGALVALSEAQDTRSAMENQKRATERLYGEKVAHFNEGLLAKECVGGSVGELHQCVQKPSGGEEELKMSLSRWKSATSHWDLTSMNPLDACMISSVITLTTP